jgi:hypothetical protein
VRDRPIQTFARQRPITGGKRVVHDRMRERASFRRAACDYANGFP